MEAAPLAAYGSIPIDPTSVVVAAVASAVRYMDWQHRKKKKAEKEEPHGYEFGVRFYKFMTALALYIFAVPIE
jgi:hypothetical protein